MDNANNTMTQSWPSGGYILKGSQQLNIIKVDPNGTVTGGANPVAVELQVETANGADEGNAACSYMGPGTNGRYVEMLETNSYLHSQPGLQLQSSTTPYVYSFFCADAGANSANATTNFTVFADTTPPAVARVYKDETGLKIVTNEDADCVYSLTTCNFEFNSGLPAPHSNANIKTNSYLVWKPNTVYYVKCKDMYNNTANPGECSAIVKPVENTIATSS
jgi:hypothetical protein